MVGPESRGFIFGVPVAYNLKKSFVPVRKKGKLPCETIEQEYELEYGTAIVEMHKDAIQPGQKVIIVDDLIATGGTMKAAAELVEELGGEVVKMLFLIELAGLENYPPFLNIYLTLSFDSYVFPRPQSISRAKLGIILHIS